MRREVDNLKNDFRNSGIGCTVKAKRMSNIFVTPNLSSSMSSRPDFFEFFGSFVFVQGSVFRFFKRQGDEVIRFLFFPRGGR